MLPVAVLPSIVVLTTVSVPSVWAMPPPPAEYVMSGWVVVTLLPRTVLDRTVSEPVPSLDIPTT